MKAVVIIDFELFTGPLTPFSTGTEDGGFDFSVDANGGIIDHSFIDFSGSGQVFGPLTPSTTSPTLTITKSGGGFFQLIRLDIGSATGTPVPHPFTGFVGAISVGSNITTFSDPIGGPLPTFSPTSLAGVNIDRLTINMIPENSPQALDNMVLCDAVGVPDTGSKAVILGMSLLGLAAVRRKLS